jgi:predicted Zn-dependent protease
MRGKELIEQLIEKTLSYSTADQLEVLAIERSSAVTRFSSFAIHQNVFETNLNVTVKAVIGKRIGYAQTNRSEKEALYKTVDTAILLAKHRPPKEDFKTLPKPKPLQELNCFVKETASTSPEQRAKAVSTAIQMIKEKGLKSSGALATEKITIGIGNTLGVKAISTLTEASFHTVVMSETSSGYASAISKDIRKIRVTEATKVAIDKALRSKNPIDINPGQYEVILEPPAVADMISFLVFAGFGALSVQEGRSFITNKLGQQIMSPLITIIDNAFESNMIGLPFDFEGMPKTKVVLVDRGVAKEIVYDSETAFKEGKESTGHALPFPNPYGPLPTNLSIQPGEVSFKEILTSTKNGLLVTRFHYTNLEDPLQTIYTGMTRNGTFRIREGKIEKGVKNLRFTQSILKALNDVEMVSRERQLVTGILGPVLAPWLKIKSFNFTGKTAF